MDTMENDTLDLISNSMLIVPGISDNNNTSVEYITTAEFILTGVGTTVLTLIGLIGNCMSAFVLMQPSMRSSVTLLLLGLTCSDTIFIIMSFLIVGLKALVYDYFFGIGSSENYWGYFDEHFSILIAISQSGSYYFTVAVTLDRCVAVWWPFKARQICTWANARYASLLVVLLSVAYNSFGTYYLTDSPEDVQLRTEAILLQECHESLKVQTNRSKLLDAVYETHFFTWPYLTFMALIPFTLLVILNSMIYFKLKEANKLRQSMTKQQNTEISFALVCCVVVTVFLCCNSAFLLLMILYRFSFCVYHHWKNVLMRLDMLLLTFNASVNFIIYCTMGSKFRRELKRLVCSRCFSKASNSGLISDLSSGRPSLTSGSQVTINTVI